MKKIVISGTYCTGKTTLSIALSRATHIPVTHALTMREILPQLYPHKTLRQCSYTELLTLGFKRLEERIRNESLLPHGFISDGCPLQEWLYGSTRMITGAYPDEYPWLIKFRNFLRGQQYSDFKKLLQGFEGIAKAYTQVSYDLFFHLPVEFPFVADGHRPTSERFRQISEDRLLLTYKEMGLHPYIISGNLSDRLEQILAILKLPLLHPVDECIAYAHQVRQSKFDSIKLER